MRQLTCLTCGVVGDWHTFCNSTKCKKCDREEYKSIYRAKYKAKKELKAAQEKAKETAKKRFEEILIECREKGITYGKWQEMKTIEELREKRA